LARLWRREVRDGQDTEDSWNGIDLHDLRHLVEEDILRGNLSSLTKALPLSPISSWRLSHCAKSKRLGSVTREYLRSAKQVRIEMMEIDATFLKNLTFI
jgi:hypothetical protein